MDGDCMTGMQVLEVYKIFLYGDIYSTLLLILILALWFFQVQLLGRH